MASSGPSAASAHELPTPPPRQPHPRVPNTAEQRYDPQAYQDALRKITPSTFACTAAAYAARPTLGPLPNPSLIDIILCDHAQALTLFGLLFQAAAAKVTPPARDAASTCA